jgi:hypothetical protein
VHEPPNGELVRKQSHSHADPRKGATALNREGGGEVAIRASVFSCGLPGNQSMPPFCNQKVTSSQCEHEPYRATISETSVFDTAATESARDQETGSNKIKQKERSMHYDELHWNDAVKRSPVCVPVTRRGTNF